MLVKEIAEKLKDAGSKKLIFFLAPKVELVKQVPSTPLLGLAT